MKLPVRLALAAAALAASLASPVLAQSPEDALPPGPGKEVVLRVCTVCHEAAQFAYARMPPQAWDTEIAKMQSAGAYMTAEEQLAISAYLGKYLSPATPAPSGSR